MARSGAASSGIALPSNPLGDQPVTLNFVDADIQAVVRALSRSTGQQFLVDPRVKGTLTLVSEGQVPARQAYDMLLAALRMQGFSVVDVGERLASFAMDNPELCRVWLLQILASPDPSADRFWSEYVGSLKRFAATDLAVAVGVERPEIDLVVADHRIGRA